MPVRKQGERTFGEPDRRPDIGSAHRPVGGCREPFSRAEGELLRLVVDGSELRPVPVRLLEVVPDDLVPLGEMLGVDLLEPVGESRVKLGSKLLRHRLVRGVADEQVTEAERVLAWQIRPVGPDQLLPDERLQVVPHRLAQIVGRQLSNGAAVEDLALDRAALDDRPLVSAQPVESRREERMDRRRNRDPREIARRHPRAVAAREQPVVDQHREHLLDEERISLRGAHDPVADGLVELRAAEEVRHELGGLAVAQSLEEHGRRVELAAAPARALVEELRTCEADEQNRRFAGPIGEVLDEVEERRLGPLEVVEEGDQRPRPALGLEEAADRPGRLVRRCAGAASEVDRGGDPLRDERCFVAGEDALDPGEWILSVVTAESLCERPVRDALAVGKAAAAHDRRLASDTRQELRDRASTCRRPRRRAP